MHFFKHALGSHDRPQSIVFHLVSAKELYLHLRINWWGKDGPAVALVLYRSIRPCIENEIADQGDRRSIIVESHLPDHFDEEFKNVEHVASHTDVALRLLENSVLSLWPQLAHDLEQSLAPRRVGAPALEPCFGWLIDPTHRLGDTTNRTLAFNELNKHSETAVAYFLQDSVLISPIERFPLPVTLSYDVYWFEYDGKAFLIRASKRRKVYSIIHLTDLPDGAYHVVWGFTPIDAMERFMDSRRNRAIPETIWERLSDD